MPDAIPASAPGAQPAPGQPPAKQAPFGSSPATGPTPNRGYEAPQAQKLGVVLKQLGEMIPLAGATSEMGMAIMDMIKKGSKFGFAPAGPLFPALVIGVSVTQKNIVEVFRDPCHRLVSYHNYRRPAKRTPRAPVTHRQKIPSAPFPLIFQPPAAPPQPRPTQLQPAPMLI